MLEILSKRRSIRKYKKEMIESEKVQKLKKAAILSPSSRSLRPLEFIFIEDKEILQELSLAKNHGSSFLKEAPLGIVIIADETKSDVWIEDASIATIVIQLAAESLGLKSCWIQIRNRMKNENESSEAGIKRILNIPENYKVLSMLSLGYPDEFREPYKENQLDYSVIKENKYQ